MQRQELIREILLVVVILLVISQSSAAYNISRVSVEPPVAVLLPGTPVSVSVKIDLPAQPLFPPFHQLRYTTELEKPKWDPDILAAGVEYPAIIKGGMVNSFSGFELSDPRVFSVRLKLEGIAPNVDQTSNITIIRIEEVDENGKVIDNSTVESTAVIPYFDECSFCDLSTFCRCQLQKFRSRIDEMAKLGVNTTIAEAKYNEAKGKIDTAAALPSKQYSAAISDLNAAQTIIADGENALDKAWAEKTVADAGQPIIKADSIIAQFETCGPTSCIWDSPEFQKILVKRERAINYLSIANDQIATGNYSAAREKAQEAYGYAKESYNIALSRQQHLYTQKFYNFNPEMFGIFIIGIVAILFCIAGIIWWKKHKQ
jgi:hypothetical protein